MWKYFEIKRLDEDASVTYTELWGNVGLFSYSQAIVFLVIVFSATVIKSQASFGIKSRAKCLTLQTAIKCHHFKTQRRFFAFQLSQTDKFNDARLKRVILKIHCGLKNQWWKLLYSARRSPETRDSLSSFVCVVNSGLSSAAVSGLMWVSYSPSNLKSSR